MVWAHLLGDPGAGESRMVADLDDWTDLREDDYQLLRAYSFPDDINNRLLLEM